MAGDLATSESTALQNVVRHGVDKAETIVGLQIEAARRLLAAADLPPTPETIVGLTQAIATTWAAQE
ncbi:MAG: hypothetical protein ABI907_00675 [Ramlibacter sp.]